MKWIKIFRFFNQVFLALFIMIVTSCGNSTGSHYNRYSDSYDEFYDEEGIPDGTYSADVDYYNPDTGYSATYTLDVEVQDGCVITIYFPNDGYLDDSQIEPTELDEYGDCTVYDYEGREYSIHIDFQHNSYLKDYTKDLELNCYIDKDVHSTQIVSAFIATTMAVQEFGFSEN